MLLTPTAVPRRKRRMQSIAKEFAREATMPNRDVKNSVALKAALLPMRSEPKNGVTSDT